MNTIGSILYTTRDASDEKDQDLKKLNGLRRM